MARPNKKGTSFCSLSLSKGEEMVMKSWIRKKGISAKHYLRFLVREHQKKENGQTKQI